MYNQHTLIYAAIVVKHFRYKALRGSIKKYNVNPLSENNIFITMNKHRFRVFECREKIEFSALNIQHTPTFLFYQKIAKQMLTLIFVYRTKPSSLLNWHDPQPGVVQEQYPRTAMCVQNVDVHVSCSSHVDAQLAAFFIDPRAKWSTVQGNQFLFIKYSNQFLHVQNRHVYIDIMSVLLKSVMCVRVCLFKALDTVM